MHIRFVHAVKTILSTIQQWIQAMLPCSLYLRLTETANRTLDYLTWGMRFCLWKTFQKITCQLAKTHYHQEKQSPLEHGLLRHTLEYGTMWKAIISETLTNTTVGYQSLVV